MFTRTPRGRDKVLVRIDDILEGISNLKEHGGYDLTNTKVNRRFGTVKGILMQMRTERVVNLAK